MFGIKRRRTLIRVLSYTVSAFCLAVIYAVVSTITAYKYRMSIEYSYQRALSELSEHVDNIDVALQKAQYAGTGAQLSGLSGEIWSNASAARTDISQMPLSTVNLTKTNKFLSQAGDYANTLSKQLSLNEDVTQEQRDTITSLQSYSGKLSTQLSDMMSKLQSGRMTLFKSERVTSGSTSSEAVTTSLEDGFLNIEDTFANLPSLIYDGPFSDNVLQKTPLYTQGKATVGKEDARKAAAGFLGVAGTAPKDAGESGGNLPTWNFTVGDTSIYISKAGGLPVRMLSSQASASSKLDTAAAAEKGLAYLQQRGFTSLTQTYYLTSNNVCTINFAYTQDGTVIYPDLVKVGVALDTGSIVSFDCTGYLMNHHDRSLTAPAITLAQAQAKLNPALTVQKSGTAVIPTDGGGEAYCYEFRTEAQDGTQVIDYFDTQTGAERQLLILKETPGGMLAM